MKPLNEWTPDYVEELVRSKEPESIRLDWKSGKSLLPERLDRDSISKDASAFANSAGGFLVYGVVERGKNPPVADDIDGVDTSKCSQQKLEHLLGSIVTPRMSGLEIKEIATPKGTVFVVWVPQSQGLGAHQALDKKYYRRHNTSCEPMHHFEVVDVMKRASTPSLFLSLPRELTADLSHQEHLRVEVPIKIGNLSSAPAYHFVVAVFVDKVIEWPLMELFHETAGLVQPEGYASSVSANVQRRVFMPSNHMPAYQEDKFVVGIMSLRIPRVPGGLHQYPIGYRVSCPGFKMGKAGLLMRDGDRVWIELDSPD